MRAVAYALATAMSLLTLLVGLVIFGYAVYDCDGECDPERGAPLFAGVLIVLALVGACALLWRWARTVGRRNRLHHLPSGRGQELAYPIRRHNDEKPEEPNAD